MANQININKMLENKINKIEKEETFEKISDFENNFELKVSIINIDSRFRNKNPTNVLDNIYFLKDNPIYTKKDSNEIKILFQNHNFLPGDRIILQNVKSKSIILNNSIYLQKGFDYFLIKIENHKITENNYKNSLENQIEIKNYDDLSTNDRLIGNIPINSILGIHNVLIYDKISITNTTQIDILNNLNIDLDTLKKDFLFLKLPFSFSSENNNNIVNDFHNIDLIFIFEFKNIGGIPIEYLNANYPINYNQFKYSHIIKRIDENNIYFDSDVVATFTDNNGSNKVYVSKIIKNIEGYPDSNEYTIDLKKSFSDVVRIELITMEIPFIEFNINSINSNKNKLYWKHFEDGDYIYSISIDEGSYGTDSLISEIIDKMNKLLRINSTEEYKIYNLFNVSINKNSQEVKFMSYKNQLLPHSLQLKRDNALANTIKLIVKQPNNFLQIGDTVIISNATSMGNISSNLINDTHEVYDINPESDTFTVIIPIDITLENIDISGTGGAEVTVRIPAKVSFLFNRDDTIGELLGFKNVGDKNAITPFSYINSNFSKYIQPNIYDTVGNIDNENFLLNLTGNQLYLFMYLNDFEGIITNTSEDNAFSKILMAGNSGDIMFNTFVNSPLEFDIPISSINQFKIKFLYPDGKKPNFRNFDHSFTLRIIEKISRPRRTNIISKKETYIDALIDKNLHN